MSASSALRPRVFSSRVVSLPRLSHVTPPFVLIYVNLVSGGLPAQRQTHNYNVELTNDPWLWIWLQLKERRPVCDEEKIQAAVACQTDITSIQRTSALDWKRRWGRFGCVNSW